MASASEHYRAAEQALAAVGSERYADARPHPLKGLGDDSLLRLAQTHATLALTSVTVAQTAHKPKGGTA